MGGRFGAADRRAALVGGVALLAMVGVYVLVEEDAAQPLAILALPCLLTGTLGGWRPTLAVGTTSLAVAVVFGAVSSLSGEAIVWRLLIILGAVAMGAAGAALRERQSGRLADLDEATALRAAFERALLPPPAPPPGYVAVLRYRPAESRLQIGGDFVEAVALADGRLAVMIGDVCGHGPREAAFGSALRAGWKAIVLSGKDDPAEWVAALDTSFFRDGRIDTYVTICVALFDLTACQVRVISLGHTPPVVVAPPVRPLDVRPFHPLGLGFDDYWTATAFPWNGEPMLFYTDGLIENPVSRREPNRWFEAGLLAWLEAHQGVDDPIDYADRLVRSATDGRELRDDVALLLIATEPAQARASSEDGAPNRRYRAARGLARVPVEATPTRRSALRRS
jgi:serine phosphatase RsbU (regulator of sigma subunit)